MAPASSLCYCGVLGSRDVSFVIYHDAVTDRRLEANLKKPCGFAVKRQQCCCLHRCVALTSAAAGNTPGSMLCEVELFPRNPVLKPTTLS